MLKFAIIGAGMAGAGVARTLSDAGHRVTVFDKSRGAGGRMATRRVDLGGKELTFDHGAQWTSAHDKAYGAFLERSVNAGHGAPWPASGTPDAVVGMPAMNVLVRGALGSIPARYGFTLNAMERRAGGWHLTAKEGAFDELFDAVVLAVPAPQLVPLVEDHNSSFADFAGRARYEPCWAAMLAFEDDWSSALTKIPHDALASHDIAWVAHDGGKPGRIGATLLAHMSGVWSTQNLEREREDIAAELAATIAQNLSLPPPLWVRAHRWRYSRVVEVARPDKAFCVDAMIGVAGDWTAGVDVEAAYLSGLRCADGILSELGAGAGDGRAGSRTP
ncbi:MAG: FAD-dependent oxidoreductase [Pseudomonadota bacterium]